MNFYHCSTILLEALSQKQRKRFEVRTWWKRQMAMTPSVQQNFLISSQAPHHFPSTVLNWSQGSWLYYCENLNWKTVMPTELVISWSRWLIMFFFYVMPLELIRKSPHSLMHPSQPWRWLFFHTWLQTCSISNMHLLCNYYQQGTRESFSGAFGIDLQHECFTHVQLYDTLSCITWPPIISFFLKQETF